MGCEDTYHNTCERIETELIERVFIFIISGMDRPIRVLVAKIGLDGHDRGAKVIAAALRDAGMEVIYSGLHNTVDAVVNMVIQEDVDVLGISILSGAHMTIFPAIMQKLKQQGITDILVIGGGIIPPDDAAHLEKIGVAKIFGPGTSTVDIIDFIKKSISSRSK